MYIKLIFILSFVFAMSPVLNAQSVLSRFIKQPPSPEQQLVDWIWYKKIYKPEPNVFQKIRAELQLEKDFKGKLAKDRGIIKQQAIELPIMTLGFFIANGLVNFNTLWDRSGGNPLKFEEQLMSQTDPITHFSFYAFMLANGVWMDYRSKEFKDSMSAETRHALFRRFMYQGLALGSLASSIVADLGQAFKDCAVPISKTPEEIDMVCNESLKRWTVSTKTQQYLPQILTLLIVQGVTDFTHATASTGIKYSTSQLYSAIRKMGPKSGFFVDAAKIIISGNPSKWSIKAISLVGLVTNLTFFVQVDHYLNIPINRFFTNLIRPPFFAFGNKAMLDCYIMWGDRHYWVKDTISLYQPECGMNNMFREIWYELTVAKKDSRTGEDIRYKDKSKLPSAKFEESFLAELDSFSMVMQDWRNNINSDIEAKLQGWLRMTNRILNQVAATEKFYKLFSEELYTAMSNRYDIKRPSSDKKQKFPVLLVRSKDFPFRTLPLFGIHFKPWNDPVTKEPVEITIEDAYLKFPVDTTQQQSLYLKEYAQQFLARHQEKLSYYKLTQNEYKSIVDLMSELTKGNPNVQSTALHNFSQFYYGQAVQNQTIDFNKIASKIFHEIGTPDSKVLPGQGFAAAFELANTQLLKQADFDLFEIELKGFTQLKSKNFSAPSEYLYHAMICGNSISQVEEYNMNIVDDIALLPDFRPASILKPNRKPVELCGNKSKSIEWKSWEDFYFRQLTEPQTNTKNSGGLINYISENFDPKIVGNVADNSTEKPFNKWFKHSSTAEVQQTLKAWDKQYQELVHIFEGNLSKRITPIQIQQYNEFGLKNGELTTAYQVNKSTVKRLLDSVQAIDFTGILGEDWVSSLRSERDFYLYLLQYLNSGLKITNQENAVNRWSFMSDVYKITHGEKGDVLQQTYSFENKAIADQIDLLINIAESSPSKILYSEYIKGTNNLKNLMKPLVWNIFEDSLQSKIDVEVDDVKKAQVKSMGSKIKEKSFDEIFALTKKIPELTLKNKITLRSVDAMLNIQDQITQAVRFKVLMTQGLSFKEEELRQLSQGSQGTNCIPKPGGGCR